jgi:hypothetical protein
MTAQALSRRVASPPLSLPAHTSHQMPASALWPNLSAEAQTQIARTLAVLMRRMRPARGGRGREIARVDRPDRC